MWYTPNEKLPMNHKEVLIVTELDHYHIATKYNKNYFKTRDKQILPIKCWCYLPKIVLKKIKCRKKVKE